MIPEQHGRWNAICDQLRGFGNSRPRVGANGLGGFQMASIQKGGHSQPNDQQQAQYQGRHGFAHRDHFRAPVLHCTSYAWRRFATVITE